MKRNFGLLLLILLFLMLVLSKVSIENKESDKSQQAVKREKGLIEGKK